MSRNVYHKNMATCLFNREYGISSLKDRLALSRFGEDMTACRTESTLKCRLPGSPRSTFLVAFSPDRKILASTHGDHTIRIIDGKTGCCLDTLEGHPRTPWSIAFHPSQGHLLASGCLAGEVRVWDLKRGRSTVYRSPESNAITSLAFHPTDLVLLVATGNQLLFWNWDQSTPFASINTHLQSEKLRLVKFDPLGHHILTGIQNCSEDTVVYRVHTRSAGGHLETENRQDGSQEGERLSGIHAARINFLIERSSEDPSVRLSTNTENLRVVSRDGIARGLLARLARLRQRIPGREMGESMGTENDQNGNTSSPHPNQPSGVGIGSAPRFRTATLLTIDHGRDGPSMAAGRLRDIQTTINHAIANALAERGDILMASNITSTTYRLQWWDFTQLDMPSLGEVHSNVIVERCKLHNDASTDISADGRLLSAFVPSENGFIAFGNVCVFSLQNYNLGQCLFSQKFGPNAISVSFSPLGRYLLVGLAAKKYRVPFFPAQQLVAQVFKFNDIQDGTSEDMEESMEHILDVNYEYPSTRTVYNVSSNAAFWHPVIGSGLVYGTNKGEVQLCHIRPKSSFEVW